MALKALMIRKKLDAKKAELERLNGIAADLITRESDIESMIAEAGTEEEQRAVEDEIAKFNADKAQNSQAISDLDAEIRELETELEAEEAEQDTEPEEAPEQRTDNSEIEKRGTERMMTVEKRNRFGITEEMVQRENVSAFLDTVEDAIKNKRAISNAGVLVPTEFLGIIRENLMDYSKLARRVFNRSIGGDGRAIVMGAIPEAVWVECCGFLNEIELGFFDVEVDCNKVAAVIPVCNSTLEDSMVALATEIVSALLQSIGKALDKAILYGTGNKMPLGVATRLRQQSQPASYPTTARPWVDLHSTHEFTIANSVTGLALFQTLLLDAAVMNNKYARGNKVWCMNETTYNYLIAQGMSINGNGQIVTAIDGRMPVIGGDVEIFDFIPAYNIVAGYFDLYMLAERGAAVIESATQTKFVEDQTIFRGKARYDGVPVIAEAFAEFAINGGSIGDVTFTADTANEVAYIVLDHTTLAVTAAAGTNHKKTITALALNNRGEVLPNVTITWASSAEAKATVSGGEVTGVASGSSVITATAGSAVGVCNVTVS